MLSKLGLKNEPGKREKWKNSRQRKVCVERALNMVQPGHCSAFLNSGLIVCETKRTVCTSQGQAFIQSFKECPENYEARPCEGPGKSKSTRETPGLNARTVAVWRRGPDRPGAPRGETPAFLPLEPVNLKGSLVRVVRVEKMGRAF